MKDSTARFELVMQVRDAQGNVTGRTKSKVADNGVDIDKFYHDNSFSKPKKKKVSGAAKSEKEIEYALKDTETYVEKIRKARKLED